MSTHRGVDEIARYDRQEERRNNQGGQEIAKTSKEGVWAIVTASFLLMGARAELEA